MHCRLRLSLPIALALFAGTLGHHAAKAALGGPPAGRTISLVADALVIHSGWQQQANGLRSTGAAKASAQIVLPQGTFAVWVRIKGAICLTVGGKELQLRRTKVVGWQRAGDVAGGPLAIGVSASQPGAELREIVFSSKPDYSPVSIASPTAPPADGLILRLDFDACEPFVCRDKALGNNARSRKRILLDNGPWGGALRSAPGGLCVGDDAPFDVTEALTLEAWVRPDRIDGYRTVLFKGKRSSNLQAIHFDLDLFDGKIEFKYKDARGHWHGILRSGPYSMPAVKPHQWSHLVATFDKGMIRLYVDGREVASRKVDADRLVPNDFPLLVGEAENILGAKAYRFSGLIDEVKVYARALAAKKVAASYHAGRASHPVGTAPEKEPEADPIDENFEQKLKIVAEYEKQMPEDTIAGQKTTASVRPCRGVPSLHINGKPIFPMAMIPIGHFPMDPCRDFAAAGVHIYSHIIWNWQRITNAPPEDLKTDVDWWLGPGQYDFEKIDRQILSIIKADPQAYIFLRVKLNPPAWWIEANPDELVHYEDGSRGPQYSLASEVWEKTYERMLRDLIGHIEKSPYAGHIIGYQPAGGVASEWYWWGHTKGLIGYSPATRKRFRKWLAEQYGGDVAALRKAWNDPEVTFDTAQPPSGKAREASEMFLFRDARQARQVIDFQRLLSHVTAGNIVRSCRIAKEATAGKKITGVFYGYSIHYATARQGLWNLGFLGLKQVLDSPDVDFLCSPTSYGCRRGGEPGNFVSAYTASYQLHDKLYWDEADVRTHLYRGPASYATRSLDETLTVLRRGFGYMLTKGTALWWFTLAGDHTFHQDEIMDDIARMSRLGNQSMPRSKERLRDVAVLVDEETFLHMRMGVGELTGPLIRNMHLKLSTMGAPYDIYLLSDMADRRMPDYKLYLFLNCFYLDDTIRKAVKSKVRKNNAVSAWFYAPGFLRADGTCGDEAMGDLTGIRLRHRLDEQPFRPVLTHFDHPISRELTRSDAFEPTAPIGPVFWADDPKAVVLARLSPGGRPGLVVRNFGSWRSVYCATPDVPTAILRGLVRYAGGHVYSTTDDPLDANGNYVMIHTSTAGKKRIVLPEPRDVRDVWTGRLIGRNLGTIDVELPDGVTRIFDLGSPK